MRSQIPQAGRRKPPLPPSSFKDASKEARSEEVP